MVYAQENRCQTLPQEAQLNSITATAIPRCTREKAPADSSTGPPQCGQVTGGRLEKTLPIAVAKAARLPPATLNNFPMSPPCVSAPASPGQARRLCGLLSPDSKAMTDTIEEELRNQ